MAFARHEHFIQGAVLYGICLRIKRYMSFQKYGNLLFQNKYQRRKIVTMDPCIPLPIPDEQLEDLVEKAKDYALMHGKQHCRRK